jgi:hypothetical protein
VSGAISQVNDKSGNNRHATQATPASRPTQLSFNGRSAMYFSGTNSLIATRPADSTHTIFAVVYAVEHPPGGGSPLAFWSTASFHPLNTGVGDMTWFQRSDGLFITTNESFGLSPAVIGWRNNSNDFISFRNGVIITAGTASNEISTRTNLYIGTRPAGGAGWIGYISEVILYDSALSTADRARVEKYLANKWAINRVHDTPGDGDFIGYWGDKSGNNRHVVTDVNAARPQYVANRFANKAALVFDGSTDSLISQTDLAISAGPATVVAVCRDRGSTSTLAGVITTGGADGGLAGPGIFYTGAAYVTDGSGAGGGNSSNTQTPANLDFIPVVIASVSSQSNTTNSWFYLNGAVQEYFSGAGVVISGATRVQVGGRTGQAQPSRLFNGDIAECLLYGRQLTALEVARLSRYLAEKWGINANAPQSAHPEVQNWINRVYANGSSVSQFTADQVTSFAREIDSAGLRSLLYRVNLFCGNDINAAFVPLYRGPVALDTRFGNEIDVTTGSGVAFTYAENTGLQGDPVSNGGAARRYLNTGVILGAVPRLVGNHHISAYMNSLPSIGTATVGTPIGVYESGSRGMTLFITQEFYNIGAFANSQLTYANATGAKAFPTNRGHYIANHISPILNIYEAGTKIGERDITGVLITTPTVFPVCVFAEGRASPSVPLFNYTNPMQGYSIGAGLTAAQALAFSQIMERFQQRLSRGLPRSTINPSMYLRDEILRSVYSWSDF